MSFMGNHSTKIAQASQREIEMRRRSKHKKEKLNIKLEHCIVKGIRREKIVLLMKFIEIE